MEFPLEQLISLARGESGYVIDLHDEGLLDRDAALLAMSVLGWIRDQALGISSKRAQRVRRVPQEMPAFLRQVPNLSSFLEVKSEQLEFASGVDEACRSAIVASVGKMYKPLVHIYGTRRNNSD